MLCTKCGKEFETSDNRCPECGSVYEVVPPHRASAGPEDNRFIVQQTSNEMVTRMLVKNDKDKKVGTTRWQNWLFIAGVVLAGIVIGFVGGFLLNL